MDLPRHAGHKGAGSSQASVPCVETHTHVLPDTHRDARMPEAGDRASVSTEVLVLQARSHQTHMCSHACAYIHELPQVCWLMCRAPQAGHRHTNTPTHPHTHSIRRSHTPTSPQSSLGGSTFLAANWSPVETCLIAVKELLALLPPTRMQVMASDPVTKSGPGLRKAGQRRQRRRCSHPII